MKLKQEIEKASDYKEGRQGKSARYNTPTEEMLTNMLNNEQVATVRASVALTSLRHFSILEIT